MRRGSSNGGDRASRRCRTPVTRRCSASSSAKSSNSTGSSSRRSPAAPTCSAAAARSSNPRGETCCRPGGSSRTAPTAPRVITAIALGSNIGDRHAHLDHAVSRLSAFLRAFAVSRYRETTPVGVMGPQRLYLNAAVVGDTTLPARDVLDVLMGIERERDRERPFPNAPRTLDLDLILFGDLVIEEPGLAVPHPRFRERRFVLEPLAEIAPALVDPVSGLTVRELFERANS